MKERSLYRLKIFVSAVGIVAFIAIVVWFLPGLTNTRDLSDEQRRSNVRQAVMNGAVLCYSVEGFFPEDLDYLKNNYGLHYDEERYLVHYRYVSADICPSVMVYDSDDTKGGLYQ